METSIVKGKDETLKSEVVSVCLVTKNLTTKYNSKVARSDLTNVLGG